MSTREVLSHRLPPFRRPPAQLRTFRSFFAFFFDVVFGPLLNAYFSLLEPQNLPKWSPNPPKIEPKTLPKSILCCERRKVISSKHSHTFAHFWLSARYKNRLEIVSKTASLLEALKNGTKNDIFPISGRLGFQTGSNMGPQNWPKTDPKLDKSSTNLYKPTRRSQNGPKPRKTSKNLQQSAKMVRTWPHHDTQILPKFMPNI